MFAVTIAPSKAAGPYKAPAAAGTAAVLRVGTYDGIPGQFTSIQAAVDAAKPGDWILIAPGDYKETTGRAPGGNASAASGVLITTKGLHLRGLDRSTTIVDATKAGTPACSNRPGAQYAGAKGLNGIMVWKADDVSVDNLTVCNYPGGSGDTGNEIWWNGGDNSGQVGGWGFTGTYLTATMTYFGSESTAAKYGIFSSNWSGGTWAHTYASNFNDSGYYIGACQQVCDQVVNDAWAEYNALGYSGSNSGGELLIEHSQFDNNEDGFDTNTQNGDNPPPQDGGCPGTTISPITHTHSCWVFTDNWVHDNNNPNVPASGSAAAGPVGTGMSISGGRNDTITGNRFERNGAWGTILVPYPDMGQPCTGGTQLRAVCMYDDYGDAITNNTYAGNGFFGNPTNGDIAALNLEVDTTSCFRGNTEEGGGPLKTSPTYLQQAYPYCNGTTVMPNVNPMFLDQALCDSQSISLGPISGGTLCLPGTHYPRRATIVMHPLPKNLPTMPDPCMSVPANPWCPGGGSADLK